MKRISFQDSATIIEVPDCPDFLRTLRTVAGDWRFAETTSAGEAVATIRKSAGSYAIHTPGEEVLADVSAVAAACSTLVDAVDGLIEANPARLCLHCGSVLMNGRLVVFPSHSHAGKSTLVARLAAAGHVVFGDDILPLTPDDNEGVGLNIAPRLRMPLPVSASAGFRQFVEAHAGPGDGRYQFLDLPAGRLAGWHQTAPLGAIVLLNRRAGEKAYLSRASRSSVLQTLVNQNFSGETCAAELLERLHAIMDRLPVVTLNYSDLDEAVALIERTFAQWPPRLDGMADTEPPPLVAPGEEDALQVEGADSTPPPPRGRKMRRKAGIHLREVDGDYFLATGSGSQAYHLNMAGAALWNLLDEPVTRDEAVEALCLAFEIAERDQVESDVAGLFSALVAAGLIEEAP